MEASSKLSVPPHLRRGALKANEEDSVQSGVRLLDLILGVSGRASFGELSMLDVGCGTKLVQAMVNHGRAVRRYVGVDVFADMIQFLADNVRDPRFSFHAVDFRNEMYNPNGRPMAEFEALPLGRETFDMVVLFSVFTHLAPEDARAMLRLVKPHVKASTGKLLFTLFIDHNQTTDFRDAVPEKPLLWAYYREPFARRLVEESGYRILSLAPPTPDTQHVLLCEPV